MFLRILLAAALLIAGPAALSASAGGFQTFSLDSAQSRVSAQVAFFGVASKSAHFPEVTGRIVLDPAKPDSIDLNVTLNARALRAGDGVTLARLKGPSFFDVERYPSVRFIGTSMRMTGQRSADVTGELTARGVTRREVLKVTFDQDPASNTGREAISFTGTMAINRRQYGMTAYSLIVGNRVTIAIRARMVPAQP